MAPTGEDQRLLRRSSGAIRHPLPNRGQQRDDGLAGARFVQTVGLVSCGVILEWGRGGAPEVPPARQPPRHTPLCATALVDALFSDRRVLTPTGRNTLAAKTGGDPVRGFYRSGFRRQTRHGVREA